jgi:hypothetical protein
MSIRIPYAPTPMAAKEVQPDAPHMAVMEQAISHNTSALWYRSMPTRHVWTWATGFEAPQASNANPAFYFATGDVPVGDTPEMQLPWCMHAAAVRIEADLYVACFTDTVAKFRLETVQMADAMSGVNGVYSDIAKAKSLVLPSGVWLQRAHQQGYAVLKRVRVSVIPSPPSSRRFALRVRASITDTSAVVRLYAMVARDVMKAP